MESSPGRRTSRRYQHEKAIKYEHYITGRYFEGRMFNYSRGGMYLDSNYAPEIGAESTKVFLARID